MIDLRQDHFDKVRKILAELVPECEVRAFGSRVTGTAKSYSDLDLAVVSESALDNDRLRILKEAFENSDLPFRVDVLDWYGISASFRDIINSRCEVVKERLA